MAIRELTEMVAVTVGYPGKVTWDPSKPDGSPRKLLNVSRLSALGWKARIGLLDGLARTYESFLREKSEGRLRA